MLRLFLLSIFLLYAMLGEAKIPNLTSRDVKGKIDEILKAHASHKSLNLELIERTLTNFCEELDPTKTYFLEREVGSWIHPTPETLKKTLEGVKKGDFSEFQEIHAQFIKAIARRDKIEAALSSKEAPKGVKNEEFKEMSWAETEEELSERILRIRGLQIESVGKLGETERERFFQHIQKRRIHREAELGSGEDSLKITLTYTMKAFTASLDAHSHYFIPSEATQFLIQVQQRLFGIGALLRDELDGLAVVRIVENSPASQKLHINDKIIAVDREPVIGLDITEAVELIRGEKDTPVVLTLLREVDTGEGRQTEKLDIELIRNEIVVEESRLETHIEPFGDGVIANLRLYSFYQDPKNSSAGDIKKAIDQIKKEHKLKGVLLDLRSNAGGLLTQAVAVTGLFINTGVVVSVKDNTGSVQHLRETEGKTTWDGPLFVLVNRASASSSEIVAQTLQDYGRALVIGDDHSFGKGTFQTFTLDTINNPKVNPLGEYTVTRGCYYTVSGKTPQLTGVQSNIVIPGLLSEMEIGEKYAKFPLENDEIEPHFDDDLSDLSPFYRLQLGPTYKLNLQEQLTTYVPYLDTLKKTSELRIKGNKSYQNFLTELKKKNYDSDAINHFSQGDLQLVEALNLMKDYIFLNSESDKR